MNAREIALKIINDVTTNDAYANIALTRELNKHKLTDQDRRFVTELVYGTIKAGKTLDYIVSHYINRPMKKVPQIIQDILRMGVYQIFFLSKVPVSAACNQAVELTKKYGHSGTVKFVNAVLRSAGRNPDKVAYPDVNTNPVQYLSLKYMHPEWIISRWIKRFGLEATESLCQINNVTPPLSIRTNTLKITRSALINVLEEEGVVCEPSKLTPEGIICHQYPSLGTLRPLQQGFFQVQDESSMLVAHILNPQPGEYIIDACGAPGGKSTHIAALMENKGTVISTDIYDHKLALTRENAERLGIKIIETLAIDATKLSSHYSLKADKVLVDAPCSGLGVLRRKPDSRWRKTESMINDLPKLQKAILNSAADCVKPGGTLVYSTCTIEPEENQNVVHAFLSSRTDFKLDDISDCIPGKSLSSKMIQLLPHVDHVDGFFIARMIKSR
ncbi:MAG: 16S rRNA (cytosine(967)-C(5))-methyltransferase RsmB [Veillonellaceae bacterium]|nr:16S rRNA (cytosine(967)-C(5))-methyltransferase RsmB [Veillonellaceae bacterium]